MKKKLVFVAIALLMVLALSGCACKHEWVEATCLTPKTCSKCEEVEGEALGHTWVEATCETPKTCSVCAATEGEALGHTWVEATCEVPKTCSVCAATEGEALGHTWVEATCEAPKTCSVCAATEGEALGHTWVEATCEAPKTCSACAATEGEALGHTWVEATCEAPKTCSVCAATEGEALGHTWVEATCEAPKTCSVCAATEGKALGHTLSEEWTVSGDKLVKNCTVCGKAGETKEIDAADGTVLKPDIAFDGLIYFIPDGMTEEESPLDIPSKFWVNMDKGWGMFVTTESVSADTTPEMVMENLSSNPNFRDVCLEENRYGEKYVRYCTADYSMNNYYFFGASGTLYQVMFLKTDPENPVNAGKDFLQMSRVFIFEDESFEDIMGTIAWNVIIMK